MIKYIHKNLKMKISLYNVLIHVLNGAMHIICLVHLHCVVIVCLVLTPEGDELII